MLSTEVIISVTFGYLILLFAITWFTERKGSMLKKWAAHPYVYSLSLAVYCTAWTFYGSVGRAAESGLDFLTIYIGPCLIAPLWWLVMRKIIRISKLMNISSIADFISSRYGKSANLGALVTIFCLFGILPYISIQIKGISSSLDIMQFTDPLEQVGAFSVFGDSGLYLALGLALFTVIFGTRAIEATARHEGLVMAVAFESIVKLISFLAIGVFVSFFLFDGLPDIFAKAKEADLSHLFVLSGENGISDWFWMGLLSMMAVLFLPRQFQMGIIENTSEKHLDTAMWLFPLYLVLINLFVLPIALSGLMIFQNQGVIADTFVLAIPLEYGYEGLAIFGYLGGFAAATSMIIVSTISLSTMVSNNLLMPILVANTSFSQRFQSNLPRILIWGRRLTIFAIILLSYFYFRVLGSGSSLVSTGLISFVAIAQLSPSIIGGIFWKKGSKSGAIWGLLAGMFIWAFTLILPTFAINGLIPIEILNEGLFGLAWLKPYNLFGMEGMSIISHSLFFSLFANLLLYVSISLFSKQNSKELNQAVLFVDIFSYDKNLDTNIFWKGQAQFPALQGLLQTFLGEKKASNALHDFSLSYDKPVQQKGMADPEFVNFAQRILSGVIGAASARILVGSVVKEEEIPMEEVLHILKETQELKSLNQELKSKTKALKKASEKLSEANEALKLNDMLKDEFISTVTHEMKTPITSIRAFSEILQDEGLSETEKKRFLQIIIDETGRMTRLIDQVLDLERFDSGRQTLNWEKVELRTLLLETAESVEKVFLEKGLTFQIDCSFEELFLMVDPDRIKQVLLNLLSNASKFAKTSVQLIANQVDEQLYISVIDDGIGIPDEDLPFLFEKFFQAKNQTEKKPIGTGLGLAISKKIMDYHGGKIQVQTKHGKTVFQISIPIQQKESQLINTATHHE
ncbi:MAG: sensor histidine kinase [Algoriphagus sp.]|uniref:ATP-binding protein n=1 Tax=Algoriphagus sp. TaxID=1872435 RepID=UPI0026256C0E|nr:sensor histidine kinase [Algoriphagus sp.]MDG1277020.1 sensor histidine kinase [Algoriphagus sp.]